MVARLRQHMLAATVGVMLCAAVCQAAKIGDVTRLKGRRNNVLVGHGLVVGLKGTGDGDKYAPAMRPLVQTLEHFANPVMFSDDLKNTKNVAIVMLEAMLPENGVREGDRVDVVVSAVGACKSLVGGRLLPTPMLQGADKSDPTIYAIAAGALQTQTEHTTTAVVKEGAMLEVSVLHNYMCLGRDLEHHSPLIQPDAHYITLVLNDVHAEWSMSNTIAQIINQEQVVPSPNPREARKKGLPELALALDPKNVLVRIPKEEIENPANFISAVENLDLLRPVTEAKIIVSRKDNTIVVTGDVEIAPAVISSNGLMIDTWVPEPPKPANEAPRLEQQSWVPVDPQERGGTRLSELVEALNRLKIPAKDRIAVLENLYRAGKIMARWVEVD